MNAVSAVRCLLIGSTLAASTGCSFGYMPRPSSRVSMAMRGGSPTFFRDGHESAGGMLGTGVLDAVRGNPTAERQAREYRTGTMAGYGLALGGLIEVLGGSTVAVANAGTTSSSSSNTIDVALALDAVGLALLVVGFVVSMNAQPHLYDAVNIYNDAVAEPAAAAPAVAVVHPDSVAPRPPWSIGAPQAH